MEFLIISGAPNTGKTTAIHRIAKWITAYGKILVDIYGKLLPPFYASRKINPKGDIIYDDFSVVIDVKGKKIIIHTATDDEKKIDELKDLIDNNKDAEIVITSCRDIGKERNYFFDKILGVKNAHSGEYKSYNNVMEVPLGKVTRRGTNRRQAMDWYSDKSFVLHEHLLKNPPFSL